MIEVSKCVICDGPIKQLKRALVAPFVAKRTWNRAPFCVNLVQCGTCGFMFYNPRLDDADLRNLYSNYRSEEYQQTRFASEPWYTPSFNEDLASASSYEFRRNKLAPILRQHIGRRKINRILDYGGDRGDLVVGLFDGAEPFVYDISGIPPAPGVTVTADPRACKPDLIINSNVLEHVGFPRLLVNEILQAAPEGGLVFLEAPCELPFGLTRLARRVAQIGIMALTRPAIARHVVRPASRFMMHEHINYFTEQSLTQLFRACGGTVIAAGSYASSGRAGKADMAWCLGSNTKTRTANETGIH
jgi:hypothetical protein